MSECEHEFELCDKGEIYECKHCKGWHTPKRFIGYQERIIQTLQAQLTKAEERVRELHRWKEYATILLIDLKEDSVNEGALDLGEEVIDSINDLLNTK